ncbi:Serine racemase [Trametes pubescens]|uniref:Serine racemase n=1 Tax=Trametes pubescens TaxID=154538 RepID=A0A1M2W6J9_TRAPU|nr:Serine racemase [Trametes pubescens]
MSANEVTRDAESTPLTRTSILAAHKAIAPHIHRTPVFTSSSLSALLPGKNTLYFKAENLQKGGAFKFRGASYSLSRLTAQELERGVCTHSSGMRTALSSIEATLARSSPVRQETTPEHSRLPPRSAA